MSDKTHFGVSSIPATMRAFVLTGYGGMDKLEYHQDWPIPKPGQTDVLIKVHACGLNNTDANTRTGWYSKGVKAYGQYCCHYGLGYENHPRL